ncbi:M23 family metallopeptidase [Nocardioides caeni]|uniref:M23 family metallopeptidase n=1 Tax=Nocardioides caeni TaxID=574700 RepID=A0A4V6T625_9ACTN|nr:M23 family metallopeptidase [Nocardioides caeni]THV18406.1 M23 family metallopeptidase [Nocardioides caeni]
MPDRRLPALAAAGVLLLTACAPSSPDGPVDARPPGSPDARTTSSTVPRSTPTVSEDDISDQPTPAAPPSEVRPDPRWQFFSDDARWHRSPWFQGAHRIMIGFGCNPAPWYSPDLRCPDSQGFHHGIDVAMTCGTRLYAGLPGVVLDPSEPGSPGPAYGEAPFRIRVVDGTGTHDVLIGHASDVLVRPGDRLTAGEPIASASDSGAPDGCHLHFEVRSAGGSVDSAVDPAPWLQLRAR